MTTSKLSILLSLVAAVSAIPVPQGIIVGNMPVAWQCGTGAETNPNYAPGSTGVNAEGCRCTDPFAQLTTAIALGAIPVVEMETCTGCLRAANMNNALLTKDPKTGLCGCPVSGAVPVQDPAQYWVYNCLCDSGFTGDGITSCTPIPTCTGPGQKLGTENACVCEDGWTGDGSTCTQIPTCTGPGQKLGTDNTCVCEDGWTGTGDTCTQIPTCTGPGQKLGTDNICVCEDGWTGNGETCTQTPACTGTGQELGEDNACVCKSGYTGDGQTCTLSSTGGPTTGSPTTGSTPTASSSKEYGNHGNGGSNYASSSKGNGYNGNKGNKGNNKNSNTNNNGYSQSSSSKNNNNQNKGNTSGSKSYQNQPSNNYNKNNNDSSNNGYSQTSGSSGKNSNYPSGSSSSSSTYQPPKPKCPVNGYVSGTTCGCNCPYSDYIVSSNSCECKSGYQKNASGDCVAKPTTLSYGSSSTSNKSYKGSGVNA